MNDEIEIARALPPMKLDRGEVVVYQKMQWLIHRQESLALMTIKRRRSNGTDEVKTVPIVELSPLLEASVAPAPARTDINLEDISSEAMEMAHKRLVVIRPLIDDVRGKTQKTKDLAAEMGVSLSTAYRWFNQWRASERVSDLIEQPPVGGKGKGRLSAEVEDVIEKKIQVLGEKKSPLSFLEIHRHVAESCQRKGLTVPSFGAVLRRIEWRDQREFFIKRSAKKRADRTRRRYQNTILAPFPLSMVQIDHAIADVIIVHDQTRSPIARPWMTIAIDVFSRMIVGIYVSLQHPSATTVGACIAHAILPKENYIQGVITKAGMRDVVSTGTEITWPVWGDIKTLHADNGADLKCDRLKKPMEVYGIERQFRPVTKPQYGGYIESYIGKQSAKMKILPGYQDNTLTNRDYDAEENARYSLAEFEYWLLEQINIYHHTPHSGLDGDTPIDRYEQGLLGNDFLVARGLPAKRLDADRVKVDFLPEIERTIQGDGVQYASRTYWASALNKWIGYREKSNPAKSPAYRFKVDDRDVTVMYFWDPKDERWYLCRPTYTGATPGTRTEYDAAKRAVKKAGGDPSNQRQTFDSMARQKELNARAVEKTLEAMKAKPTKGTVKKPTKGQLKADQKNREQESRRSAQADAAKQNTTDQPVQAANENRPPKFRPSLATLSRKNIAKPSGGFNES